MISSRLTYTAHLTTPSLSSLMSTSPAPATPSTHNYLSNVPVETMKALITLMHQTLHKSTTMMEYLQTRTSTMLVQQTPITPAYKPQLPPLYKMGRDATHHPLLISKVATYKSEAFYSGVRDWTKTIISYKHLSVAIYANMLASLPQSVSSMLLNDLRFASNRITIIWHSITHLDPSSSENILLGI